MITTLDYWFFSSGRRCIIYELFTINRSPNYKNTRHFSLGNFLHHSCFLLGFSRNRKLNRVGFTTWGFVVWTGKNTTKVHRNIIVTKLMKDRRKKRVRDTIVGKGHKDQDGKWEKGKDPKDRKILQVVQGKDWRSLCRYRKIQRGSWRVDRRSTPSRLSGLETRRTIDVQLLVVIYHKSFVEEGRIKISKVIRLWSYV